MQDEGGVPAVQNVQVFIGKRSSSGINTEFTIFPISNVAHLTHLYCVCVFFN